MTPHAVVEQLVLDANDLLIDGFHSNQATQQYRGDVPLVAGREGLARIFVLAGSNVNRPVSVLVEAYDGTGTPLESRVMTGMARSPRDQSSLGDFDFEVPTGWTRDGLMVRLTVDPDNEIAESNETNNHYPPSGLARLEVRDIAKLRITLVPVEICVPLDPISEATACFLSNLDATTAEYYLDKIGRIYPLPGIAASTSPGAEAGIHYDLHPVFRHEVERQDCTWVSGICRWGPAAGGDRSLYNRIGQLYEAERENFAHHFAGLFPPGTGASPRGAASPRPPGSRHNYPILVVDDSHNEIFTHEIGHNLGRGGHSNFMNDDPWSDPYVEVEYPYDNGFIGTFGYDLAGGELKAPRDYVDVMGGITLPPWISDYTYRVAMATREYDAETYGLLP